MKNLLTNNSILWDRRSNIRIVAPQSTRRETFFFLSMVFIVIFLINLRIGLMDKTNIEYLLKPYQKWSDELDNKYMNLYRHLQVSQFDIVNIRDQEGAWPEPFILSKEFIPPFTKDLLPRNLQNLEWLSYDGGTWIDYLGMDTSSEATKTVILRIIDLHADYHPHPHPGVDYDPNQYFATQIWFFPKAQQTYPGERLPEAGWQWYLTPSDNIFRNKNEESQAAN